MVKMTFRCGAEVDPTTVKKSTGHRAKVVKWVCEQCGHIAWLPRDRNLVYDCELNHRTHGQRLRVGLEPSRK